MRTAFSERPRNCRIFSTCLIQRNNSSTCQRRLYKAALSSAEASTSGSPIRTLLLTSFYRQMPQLIARGHIYIAQPPLFRAKRGRTENYIKNEQELEAFLVRRAVE